MKDLSYTAPSWRHLFVVKTNFSSIWHSYFVRGHRSDNTDNSLSNYSQFFIVSLARLKSAKRMRMAFQIRQLVWLLAWALVTVGTTDNPHPHPLAFSLEEVYSFSNCTNLSAKGDFLLSVILFYRWRVIVGENYRYIKLSINFESSLVVWLAGYQYWLESVSGILMHFYCEY